MEGMTGMDGTSPDDAPVKTKHCKTKSLLGQCHGRGGGHQPQHQHDNDNDDEEDVDDIAENLCVWQHRGG